MQNLLSSAFTSTKSIREVAPNGLETIVGEQVYTYLTKTNFSTDWETLYEQCPWSTPFQSYDFISTWYKLFKEAYSPILVLQTRNNKLVGLLPLALDVKGKIVYAGADLAEYQVWLANPIHEDEFIEQAILEITTLYPGKTIPFKFIPASAPLHWIERNRSLINRCEIIIHRQPLLKINYDSLVNELKKKNRKEKVNRLKRLGDLQFTKVTDPAEFDFILKELVIQSDFRKGAMFDSCLFINSAARKEFLSSLFRLNLLHVTTLKLNDAIIASNVGIFGKKWLHLQGINTHSPTHAKYSPGILHFLMLGLLLSEEKFEIFDLTPGNDGYKETIATDYDVVYEVNIHTLPNLLLNKFKRQTKCSVQSRLQKIGISASALKNLTKLIQIHQQKVKLLKHYKISNSRSGLIKNHFTNYAEPQNINNLEAYPSLDPIHFKVNSLADLLHYNPKGTLQTRWEFLGDAMKRFEAGQQCYTWLEDDFLLACAWISSTKTPNLISPSPKDFFLERLYMHPSVANQIDRVHYSILDTIIKMNTEATLQHKLK